MRPVSDCADRRALGFQLGIVVSGVLLVNVVPVRGGSVLLVPLTAPAHASVARLAVDAGAVPVATGPLPGSIVVRADGRWFGLGMIAAGVLPLAADTMGCGGTGERPS